MLPVGIPPELEERARPRLFWKHRRVCPTTFGEDGEANPGLMCLKRDHPNDSVWEMIMPPALELLYIVIDGRGTSRWSLTGDHHYV